MDLVYYTAEQISFILALRKAGESWENIRVAFNTKFSENKSSEALRYVWKTNKNFHAEEAAEISVKNLKAVRTTSLRNSKVLKENNRILDYLNAKDTILEEVAAIVKKMPKLALKTKPIKRDKRKKNMTLELMVSDVHFGKLTKTFNLAVCRARLQELVQTVHAEIARSQVQYNVERIILGLIGDIIESFTMHGLESASSSECNNSEQINAAIETLFFDVVLPLAKTGIQLDVVGVPGNHDRTEKERTLNNPGRTNVTWVIYHAIRLLTLQTGLKNVTFDITEGASVIKEVYGKNILFEHGDLTQGPSREALEKHMNQRAVQCNQVLHFFRLGHFHEPTVFGRGKIIINGSVPGQDSYSELKGYNSEPVQVLNFYVDTANRPTPFYRSFPIYLK